MTINEFNEQKWGSNIKAIYRGYTYGIAVVNFQECLVGLDDGTEDYTWARCENIEIVPPNAQSTPK